MLKQFGTPFLPLSLKCKKINILYITYVYMNEKANRVYIYNFLCLYPLVYSSVPVFSTWSTKIFIHFQRSTWVHLRIQRSVCISRAYKLLHVFSICICEDIYSDGFRHTYDSQVISLIQLKNSEQTAAVSRCCLLPIGPNLDTFCKFPVCFQDVPINPIENKQTQIANMTFKIRWPIFLTI